MAISSTKVRAYRNPLDHGIRHAIYAVTLDNSYSKGTGFAFPASLFNMTTLDFLTCNGPPGYICVFDRANLKLKVYEGDNDAGADGPFTECENSDSNLNGVTFDVMAQGT